MEIPKRLHLPAMLLKAVPPLKTRSAGWLMKSSKSEGSVAIPKLVPFPFGVLWEAPMQFQWGC